MSRSGWFSSLACSAIPLLICSGCSGPSLPNSLTWAEWNRLPTETVTRGKEWREARHVPAGRDVAINLGEADEQAILRLGVAGEGDAGEDARIRIFLGDSCVAAIEVPKERLWQDHRVEIPANPSSSRQCVVIFDSQGGLWVSSCELEKGNEAPGGVLLVLIDTLRQDSLGCYGYHRPTSPAIDALALDAIRFTELVPQSSWTRPSVASLLTSTYPTVHGAEDHPDAVRPGLATLEDALKRGGYETHVLMGNPSCLPLWGLCTDFSRGLDLSTPDVETMRNQDEGIVGEAIQTVRLLANGRWFLYVHLMSPHQPYLAPSPYNAVFLSQDVSGSQETVMRTWMKDSYDGEIAYVDSLLGPLFNEMKGLGVWDNSYVVLLADHGEQFWEHGNNGHGMSLFEEEIRVPFLLKLPHSQHAGTVCKTLIEMVDVAPTLLDLLGLPREPRFQGSSFSDLVNAETTPSSNAEEQIAYASLRFNRHDERMAKTVSRKYIRKEDTQRSEWYNLREDPTEQRPLLEAPDWGAPLVTFADHISDQGAAGLHVLITDAGTKSRTITGRVLGVSPQDTTLLHPGGEATLQQGEGEVTFKVVMKEPTFLGAVLWAPFPATRNSAHLHANVPPDAKIKLELASNDTPIPSDVVRFGPSGERRPLPISFTASDATAPSDAYHPARLPTCFQVYVWYVPAGEEKDEDTLPDEMRESLRALGYVK